MRRPGFARSIIAVLCALVGATSVLAQTSSDLCNAPQMKTEKWKSRPENGGMTLLLPPGFGATGIGGGVEESGAHYYQNGEHRTIVIGFGPGLQSLMRYTDVSEKGECETTIAGRRVSIIIYNWVVEDPVRSASGNAGAHFAAVARYYPSGSQREVYIALISNVASELKYFKPIFWAVTFDGSPAVASASPSSAHQSRRTSGMRTTIRSRTCSRCSCAGCVARSMTTSIPDSFTRFAAQGTGSACESRG